MLLTVDVPAATTQNLAVSGQVLELYVDWGDGTAVDGPFNGTSVQPQHTYQQAGSYQISVSGLKLEHFGGYTQSNQYIPSIDDLGTIGISDLSRACWNCQTLTHVPVNLPPGVTNLAEMFASAQVFSQDLSGWDTSSVTNLSMTFYNASGFNGSLAGWNTSKVTNFSSMFESASKFNQDVSGFDTSAALNMANMFAAATAFNNGSPSNDESHPLLTNASLWDVSKVQTFSGMFA
jgi:surface protein